MLKLHHVYGRIRLPCHSSGLMRTLPGYRLLHSGLEPQDRYEPGGYHRVTPGEIYNNEYEVIRKLGWGIYSTVWLVRSTRSHKLSAMKIALGKMDALNKMAGWDELGVLDTIGDTNPGSPGLRHICQLQDHFIHQGPHGSHTCIVLEALNWSAYRIYRSFPQFMPLPIVKRICKDMLLALQYLHDECDIVHTDIKGDNIILAGDPPLAETSEPVVLLMKSAVFKLTDFGTATRMSGRRPKLIQPESLRAPEVLIGVNWDAKADIWNLGCLIYEFARGTKLFDPHWETENSGMSPVQTHLAQIQGLCWNFPEELIREGEHSPQLFGQDLRLRMGHDRYCITIGELLSRAGHSTHDVAEMSAFLSKMLTIDPEKRWSARQLLQHPWMESDISRPDSSATFAN